MKKIILFAVIAVVALLSSTPASAQKGYRGFVDAELGLCTETLDSRTGFAGEISTIHGFQAGNSFFGAGVGIKTLIVTEIENTVSIPMFVQYRYDYSLISNHSFYGKAKVGYAVIENTIFYGVGGGIRFSLNNNYITAFNLGLNLSFEKAGYRDYKASYCIKDNLTIMPALTFGIEF